MSRLNQILSVILVVQIALVGLVFFWPQPAAEAGGGPLISDFSASDVTGLTVNDNEDNRITLAKNGSEWVLPEADDFPADSEKITPILEKIAGIDTNRLVTETEASHKRLQVASDDFNRRVELTMAGGAQHELYVGSSAGAGATHVRIDDQTNVYLTAELSAFDVNAQAASWIDTLYFTVPQTATVALTLENANGTFEFEKENDTWTLKDLAEGETLNESNVTQLVNSASSVRMTEPIGKEEETSFGLDQPQAILTLTTADETYTLQVGAQDETDNSYVLKASNSPYYVRVAQFTGDSFVNKTRDDFLQQPPTEEPAPTDTGSSQ
jgi:hypothetical protein